MGLAKDGYFQLSLHNGHELQVWTTGKLCILKHPKSCDESNPKCREALMKYIENEGILDEVDKIVMLDSYAS